VIEKMTKKSPEEEKTKKAGVGGGVPTPHEEKHQEQAKEEKKGEEVKEEKTRYVIQYNKSLQEEGYLTLKKEGKVWVTESKDKAEGIAEKLMQRHADILMVRICRVKDGVLIPVTEYTGRDIIEKSKNVLPEEFKGIIQEEMLEFMDQEEIGSIRNLISEYLRKKEQIEQFSRLAVQRSSFKRNKEKMQKLEEIKKKYQAAKETYEEAKEIWDKAREEAENFISEEEKHLPAIGRWLRIEITGVGRTVRRTSGRTRVTGGKRQLILQFLRDNKGSKFSEKEIRERLKQQYQEYSWSQQSCWAAIKSLREEGIINRDSEGRYYLP